MLQLLKSFQVPDLGDVEPNGLIVVVGPNSSGKTHLLRDIQTRATGQQRDMVVVERITFEKPPDLEAFLKTLEDDGHVQKNVAPNGGITYLPNTPQLGLGQGIGQNDYGTLKSFHKSFIPHEARTTPPEEKIAFLKYFGPLLTTSLFLENRLTQQQFQSSSFDYESARPSTELQAVYDNKSLSDALSQELSTAFNRAIWIDNTRSGTLCLRVSDQPNRPSAEDRLNPRAMTPHRLIQTEGDGLKSYCSICLALLPSRRPLCLIDEPELCLHPPQAYSIGHFIAAHAAKNNGCVLVATHSSQVLRGMIQANTPMQLIRLARRAATFRARRVRPEVIRTALKRPATRSDAVLDGIFADAWRWWSPTLTG